MRIVVLTALGVGGATMIGAVLGVLFKNISHRFSDIVLSFAAGIMLAAAVLGRRASFWAAPSSACSMSSSGRMAAPSCWGGRASLRERRFATRVCWAQRRAR